MIRRLLLGALLCLAGCAHQEAIPPSAGVPARASQVEEVAAAREAISVHIGDTMYGPGAQEVLRVAAEALAEKHAAGEAQLVGLEDLWAHALQEGLILFNDPERRWGRTGAELTGDMIGQTTVGPWQMTVRNIREIYGPPYGLEAGWSDAEVMEWARRNPPIQAKMIADYIQRSYEQFGRRSPYAIQRYFWLEPYVRGEIGQAQDWTKSPVARPPQGMTWQDLTPAMKRDTGFYAKQVLMGTAYTKSGLLYWLLVTGQEEEEAREALRVWRDQRRVVMEEGEYVVTDEPGGFAIAPSDVRFADHHPEVRDRLARLARDVAAGE